MSDGQIATQTELLLTYTLTSDVPIVERQPAFDGLSDSALSGQCVVTATVTSGITETITSDTTSRSHPVVVTTLTVTVPFTTVTMTGGITSSSISTTPALPTTRTVLDTATVHSDSQTNVGSRTSTYY